MTPTLTIGIPTYHRADSVERRLIELRELALPHVRVLVIDNASPDGTYERLTSRFAFPGLRILRNETNLGFSGNFLRLVEEADTDYVTVVSDEDAVFPEALESLSALCEQKQPLMVSPRAESVVDPDYRGRRQTRLIAPHEFESASFYLSGLTYRCDFFASHIDAVRALTPSNSAATLYPQVLLTALAVAEGGAYFLDALLSTQTETQQTHIADPVAPRYAGVAGRWAQLVGYEEFLGTQIERSSGEKAAAFAAMREHLRTHFYTLFIDAVRRDLPVMESYLAASAHEARKRHPLTALARRLGR